MLGVYNKNNKAKKTKTMVAFWMADGDGGLIKSQSLKRRQLLSLIHHDDHHGLSRSRSQSASLDPRVN